MAYSIRGGIENHRWQRFVRDSGLALPLIAVLFIIVAVLSVSTHHSSGQSPYIPTETQASSASRTSGGTGTNSSNPSTPSKKSGSSSSQPTASQSQPATGSTPAMSFGNLSSGAPLPIASSPSTSGVSGGLGGGDATGTTSGSSGSTGGSTGSGSVGSTSGSSGSTGGGSTPTVACTNLLTLAQVCTACTPPLTLQPGQKALLSADGTCVAAN